MYPLIYFNDGSLGVDIACRHGEEYVKQLRSGNVEAKEHFIEIISYLRSMPEEDLLELGEDSALRNEYIKIIIN